MLIFDKLLIKGVDFKATGEGTNMFLSCWAWSVANGICVALGATWPGSYSGNDDVQAYEHPVTIQGDKKLEIKMWSFKFNIQYVNFKRLGVKEVSDRINAALNAVCPPGMQYVDPWFVPSFSCDTMQDFSSVDMVVGFDLYDRTSSDQIKIAEGDAFQFEYVINRTVEVE